MLIALKPAMAQDSEGVDGSVIDIIKPYQPILADAVKISFAPQIEKNKNEKVAVDYSIPAKLFDVPYTPPMLKPAAMPKDNSKSELPTIYAKIGLGNYFGNYEDLIYSNTKNKNFNYGAEISNYAAHSSTYTTKAIRETALQLYGTLYSPRFSMSGILKYENDKRNTYSTEVLGMNSDSTLRYHLNKISAKIRFENTTEMKLPFDWKSSVNAYSVNKNFTNNVIFRRFNNTETLYENGLNWNNQFLRKRKNGDKIICNVNWNWSELSTGKSFMTLDNSNTIIAKQPNNLLTVNPYYQFNKPNWTTELGLNAAFSSGVFVLMPHYESTKNLVEKYLIFYTGWKGWVQKNSYWNLQQQCIWLGYSALQNSYNQDVYIGVKGTDNKRISYNLKFSRLYYQHFGMVVNADSIRGGELKMKYVSDATILNFHADAAYNKNEKLVLGGAFDYFNFYKLPENTHAWHISPLKLNLNASYKLADKVKLNLAINSWGSQKYLLGSKTNLMDGAVDLSLGATYNYNKNISAFVQLNNLLNQHYYSFYGFQSFGLNGLLGVVCKF